MSSKVSVIVVNFNCKEIGECIESVKKNNYPKKDLEIIVVDNNSSEEHVKKLKLLTGIKLVPLDKNYGYGIGCNYGAKYAHGKYLVFLNPDSVVDKNWLRNLVETIESDDKIGTATSKIMYYDYKNKVNSLGCFLSTFGICGSLSSPSHLEKSASTKFNVFAPSGASFIIKKETFKKLDGFDENLFLYAEDVDLGWRVLNMGLENILSPNSIVYHKTQLSTLQKSDYFYFYNTRNNLLITIKNATFPHVISMPTFSLFFQLSRALVFAIVGRIAHAKSTLKGVLWVFFNLNKIMEIRNSQLNRNGKYVKFVTGIRNSIPVLLGKTVKHLN